MTREEAHARAEELNRRTTHRFFARERAGDWEVVRVALPPGMRIDPLKATVEARPRPSLPPDPRPGTDAHVAGF